MNLENTRQELARRLVQREVVQCVSTLMSGILAISHHVPYRLMQDCLYTDADALMELFQRSDYEEAARQFIMDDADIDQLEEIADQYGYWSDVLRSSTAPDGLDDIDEYLEAHPEMETLLRKNTWNLLDTDDEYQWVCNEYALDPDQIEVYEHWVVSDWLAKKLAGKGEITGDFAGLTIWGRCTTGQSISMDSAIQSIAMELWPEGVSE